MNPSGQPQPGQQNNQPPYQPQPGGFPPAPTGYQQPQAGGYSTIPANYGQPQVPGGPAQPGQFGQPYAQQYGQPAPPPGPDLQPVMPQQYSADYLDQIAPPKSGPTLFSGNFTWIIVGLAVLFMFAVGILVLNNGGNNTVTAQTAYMRIDSLILITNNYRRYLKSSSLSSTNSNYKIFLTGALHDLVDPLAKNGVATNKLDKDLKTKEKASATEITSKLEDARLNAILDRSYAREMAYQSNLLLEMYKKMLKNKGPGIADNAKKTISNLEPLQKAFADFKESD